MSILQQEIKDENTYDINVCRICLSVDRKLFPIGAHSEMYQRLTGQYFNNFNTDAKISDHLRICWECEAILKKMKIFQQKANKAEYCLQLMINQGIPTDKSFSTLINICTTEVNYRIVYNGEEHDIPHLKTNLNTERGNDSENVFEADDNTITFVDTRKDGYDEIKIEDLIKTEKPKICPSNRKIKKCNRWMMKRAMQNRKPKFKMIVQDDNIKSGVTYRKINIDYRELIKWREKMIESDLYKTMQFKCDKCISGFNNKKSYIKHNEMHHRKTLGKYECDICKSKFSNKKLLEKHCKNHYYKFECTLCSYVNFKRHELYIHWKYEHARKFECLKCKQSFWTRKEFYRHYKKWHQHFVCDYCGKSFKMRYCIKQHIRKQHNPFVCKLCDKKFARYNGLWLHNKVKHPVHELERAYCVECNKHFDNIYSYKWHLNNSVVHKPKKRVKVPCPSCDKVFSKNIYMKDHYDLVHLKNYKYRCDTCEKNFSRNADLVKHRKRIHEGIQTPKNKICYVCGRGFSSNKILNNHIRTHTGERPFQCPLCPAKFAQKVAMVGHQRNVHFKGGKSAVPPIEISEKLCY